MKKRPSIEREVELFEAAKLLPDPQAQAAFLKQACPRNKALRRHLQELLDIQSQAEQFFADFDNQPESVLRPDGLALK